MPLKRAMSSGSCVTAPLLPVSTDSRRPAYCTKLTYNGTRTVQDDAKGSLAAARVPELRAAACRNRSMLSDIPYAEPACFISTRYPSSSQRMSLYALNGESLLGSGCIGLLGLCGQLGTPPTCYKLALARPRKQLKTLSEMPFIMKLAGYPVGRPRCLSNPDLNL